MTAAATELQRTVFAALAGDIGLAAMIGGNKVFDYLPPKAGFPYISFGRSNAFDWSTGTEAGSEHVFSLHVWSQAKGKKEALAVMERMRALLDDASLSLDAHHLVLLRLEQTDMRYEPDTLVHHGTMLFRALVESTPHP